MTNDRRIAYLLVSPTIAVLVALSIYPLIHAITVSLKVRSGGVSAWSLGNFSRLFSDHFFLAALGHTLVYATSALTLEFLLGLGLAVLMNNQLRGRSFFRAALLVPMMLPTVVAGVVWRLMLNPNFGAVNGTLKGMGLNTSALTWTSSPRLAMLSVVAVDVWQWTPFMFLILLAGLQAIPQERTPRGQSCARGCRPGSGGAHRRLERVANVSSCNSAFTKACNPGCAVTADYGPVARVRSGFYSY